MAPVTDFAVKEKYSYLYGFGAYHQFVDTVSTLKSICLPVPRSEALPGANPIANSHPQRPPYGLRTERISGTSFTAPREQNLQTHMYRVSSSLNHSKFTPYSEVPAAPKNLTPDSYLWTSFGLDRDADWTQQRLLARSGDPAAKTGLAIWIFSVSKDMPERTVFSSLDGDILIIPQSGAIDVQTELGRLLVRQTEIAVIPRAVRYRMTLPAGPARGYICELFQGHYRLPDLGVIGSTGLANIRDFQIPTACFDGDLQNGSVRIEDTGDWTVISRLGGRLWSCKQQHTPFDVVAWHGTNYPYKYDLARFEGLGNVTFNEHDPSLYTVLTAPSYGEPGHSVVDFAFIGPRWQVPDDTLWVPYFHRNTCAEFYGPIVNLQDPKHPLNAGHEFAPFAAGLDGGMSAHGSMEKEFQEATNQELKPKRMNDDGISIFLLETEKPLFVCDWAEDLALRNFRSESKM